MPLTLEAGRFLAQLLESGRLPGAENAEKGAMLSPASADTLLPNVYTPQPTNYPLFRTFNGQRKLGGPWENHYTVVKMSADSPWQLQEAWRTDAQGKTVEEYSIQSHPTGNMRRTLDFIDVSDLGARFGRHTPSHRTHKVRKALISGGFHCFAVGWLCIQLNESFCSAERAAGRPCLPPDHARSTPQKARSSRTASLTHTRGLPSGLDVGATVRRRH